MSEFIYSRNGVMECLRANRRDVFALYLGREVTKDSERVHEIMAIAKKKRIPVVTHPKNKMDHLVRNVNHQGIILEVSPYPYANFEEIMDNARSRSEAPFILILDILQDPQNVGTLIRTADAVGVHGVFIQDKKAVDITPSVVASSSGAVEHLSISMTSNISQVIMKLKENNVWVYGLSDREHGKQFDTPDYHGGVALVVGNEGEGLRSLVAKNCDELISIPMKGKIESLNAAIAGSLALYQVWEQKKYQ